MKVEEEYTDVLQNLEFAVVQMYRNYPKLSDHDVMRIYEALTDQLKAEKVGRDPRPISLSPVEKELFDAVRAMCEWRLGRGRVSGDETGTFAPPKPITVDAMLLCLKRLIKSVKTWTREGGSQGYLNFIIQYVR